MSDVVRYWVTAGRGFVHATGCFRLKRAQSATVWAGSNVFPTDHACPNCLPDGLPTPPGQEQP